MSRAKTSPDRREPRYAIGDTPEERLENARKALATARGKAGATQGSRTRALRLPDATWRDLEAAAKNRKMTVLRFLRVLLAEHLYTRPSPTFLQLVPTTAARATSGSFEIVFASGVVLRVPHDFDDTTLARLVGVLESRR